MLEVIKMNKKQPFEAFKIPEDGDVNLIAISSWLGDNGINMRSIKPGHYIVKDMNSKSSRVSIIDEETLNNYYDIKGKSWIDTDLDLKGELPGGFKCLIK